MNVDKMANKIGDYEIQYESRYGYKSALDYLNELRDSKKLAGDLYVKHEIKSNILTTILYSSGYRRISEIEYTLISGDKEYIDSVITSSGFELINKEIERVNKINLNLELNDIKRIKQITILLIADVIKMWTEDLDKKSFSRYLSMLYVPQYLTTDDIIFLDLSDLKRRIEEHLPYFGYVVINGYIQEL